MVKSKETLCRTFIKTLGWRTTATTITVVSTYLISGSFDAAWKVGTIDLITKLSGHLVYEKLWSYCKWGYILDDGGDGREGNCEEGNCEEGNCEEGNCEEDIEEGTGVSAGESVLSTAELELEIASHTAIITPLIGTNVDIGNDENNGKNYLIVYHHDYVNEVDRLATYRREQGWNVICEEYVSGGSKKIISTVDRVRRRKIGEELMGLKYLLLVGSIEEVPSVMREGVEEDGYISQLNSMTKCAASDMSYGLVGGKFVTVVGRLTCGDNIFGSIRELTVAERVRNVSTQIDKIVEYEGASCVGEKGTMKNGWKRRVVGVASGEGTDGGIDGLCDRDYMDKELEKLRDVGMRCEEIFDNYESRNVGDWMDSEDENEDEDGNGTDEAGDGTATQLCKSLNKGCALMAYVGHANEIGLSTTGFDTDDLLKMCKLGNGKYFVGCAVGCSVGSHDEKFMSLSEGLQVAEGCGSVAFMSSTIMQSWKPPMFMQRTLIDGIVKRRNRGGVRGTELGELYREAVSAKQFMPVGVENGESKEQDFWYYTLFGDPATNLAFC